SPRMVSDTSVGVRNSGGAEEPVVHVIAPNLSVGGLVFELLQNGSPPLLIHPSVQEPPFLWRPASLRRTVVMRIVNVLNHGFARMKHVSVGHVMHEEKQVIGTSRERFVHMGERRRILPDVAGTRCDSAVHSDSLCVRAVPLSP